MRVRLCLICWAVLALLAGCGGGGGGGSTGGSGGISGELMDPQVRDAALTSLFAEYKRLAVRAHPERRQQFIDFVLANSAFKEAGWSEDGDNFWATFQDGVPFAMLDNEPPSEEGPSLSLPSRTRAAVPKSKTAHVYFSKGNAFVDDTVAIEQMLDEAGYDAKKSSGQLQELMNDITSDGYFYWSTHSGFFEPKTGKGPIITTLTVATPQLEAQEPYKSMIKNGFLAIAGATTDWKTNPTDDNGDGTIDIDEKLVMLRVFSITPKFVETYLQFDENSVVVMQSCTSADKQFADAFVKGGAHVYLGWDAVVVGGHQMTIFTDRIIGANVMQPLADPPIRPFDANAVLAWMKSKGLDYDGYQAHLALVLKTGTKGGLLAPSIDRIEIDEGDFKNDPNVMTIYGEFGPKDETNYKRELFIAGQPITITGGDSTTITANIPTSGLGSSGNVIVKVGGRSSNVVPITAWDIFLTNKHDDAYRGTAKIQINFHLKFRGDVHKSRLSIDGEPGGSIVTMEAKSDSTATWSASGITESEDVLGGSGTVEAGVANSFGSRTITALLRVNPKTAQVVGATAYLVGPIYTVTNDDEVLEQLVQSIFGDGEGLPNLPFAFQPGTYTVQGSTFNGTFGEGDSGIIFENSWSTAQPTFPPTEDTES